MEGAECWSVVIFDLDVEMRSLFWRRHHDVLSGIFFNADLLVVLDDLGNVS